MNILWPKLYILLDRLHEGILRCGYSIKEAFTHVYRDDLLSLHGINATSLKDLEDKLGVKVTRCTREILVERDKQKLKELGRTTFYTLDTESTPYNKTFTKIGYGYDLRSKASLLDAIEEYILEQTGETARLVIIVGDPIPHECKSSQKKFTVRTYDMTGQSYSEFLLRRLTMYNVFDEESFLAFTKPLLSREYPVTKEELLKFYGH